MEAKQPGTSAEKNDENIMDACMAVIQNCASGKHYTHASVASKEQKYIAFNESVIRTIYSICSACFSFHANNADNDDDANVTQ